MSFEFVLEEDYCLCKQDYGLFKEIGLENIINEVIEWYSKNDFENWREYEKEQIYTHNEYSRFVSYILYTIRVLTQKVSEILAKQTDALWVRTNTMVDYIENLLKVGITEWLKGQVEHEWKKDESLADIWDCLLTEENPVVWRFFDEQGYKIYLNITVSFFYKEMKKSIDAFIKVTKCKEF